MEILIDGEVADTYGGDYTWRYLGYEVDESGIDFYEWFSGAKESGRERLIDSDDVAGAMRLLMED